MATLAERIRSLWGQWGTGTTGCRLPALPRQSTAALPLNLKRLRHQRGLTVAELSRAAVDRDGPVSRSTIRAIERGAINPTLHTVLALAQALGVEVLVEDGP
jgi:DNA-binding XRE family transcriptional regulator